MQTLRRHLRERWQAVSFGALYGAGLFVPVVSNSYRTWAVVSWIAAGAGIALALAIALAIATVYPRLRSVDGQGFIFWKNIVSFRNRDSFRTSFDSQSAHTLNEHLLNQNYSIAKHVCTPKYRKISFCLILLSVGAALAAGAFMLKARWATDIHKPPSASSAHSSMNTES